MSQVTRTKKRWYEQFPHPLAMLFFIILFAAFLTYILPSGQFDRELVDGRQRVIAGTFHEVDATPVGIMDIFTAMPLGYKGAAEIIFIVLASAIMFGIFEKTKMIENTVGTLVKKMGLQRKYIVVILMTFIFGLLGIVIGYENNIALVPIACLVSLALGGDLMLGAGMSVAAITIGFGLSPINPYTVGTGHKIAEMPIFSGAILRTALVVSGLSLLCYWNVRYFRRILEHPEKSLSLGLNTEGFALSKPLHDYSMTRLDIAILSIFLLGLVTMLVGVFTVHWYINEISAIFLMVAIVSAIAARMTVTDFCINAFKSINGIAAGASLIGFAYAIKVVLDMGNVSDSIAYYLSDGLQYFPTYISAVLMTLAQSVINMVIPSGSGQALATLPIMIPVGELIGLTRQTTILAFQIGDGLTNIFNPALGGLIAMLALCRIPFDRWLKFIMPLVGIILIVCWIGIIFSVLIDWGPI